MSSLAYHAASGIIAVSLRDHTVELWQTDPYIAPCPAAPLVGLPFHVCVRERLVEAQAQMKDIEASIEKTGEGLRQQMSREQEQKQSIADLEAKRAYHIFMYL